MEVFDPKVHVCKFFFQQHDIHAEVWNARLLQKISGDLYQNELKIELLDGKGNAKMMFGYKLEEPELAELLPLLHWEDFEKNRDGAERGYKRSAGYRDGWGYEFVCLNESGAPLISDYMTEIFQEKYKPADEKLLDWIIDQYSKLPEYKKLHLLW